MEEDERTEFKSQLTKESMKTVVAFSNTAGGTLYYGLDDDGSPVGVKDVDAVSLDLIHLLADTIRPDVTATTDVEHISMGGKDVIRVDVLEGPTKPYYLREKGLRTEGVYIRKGPSSIQASESLIIKMIREGAVSYESSISLEQDLTFDDASEVFRDSNVEFGEAQKKTMGFYAGELYTVLAYLISDQCQAGIKLAAYSDEYKNEFLDRAEVKGSVLTQAEKALSFINTYNPLVSKIEGLRRNDYRAYPVSSLREALINAVVHRDYSISADTLVSIFGDRMSIASYGGLRRGIGVDDLMMGISSPRNPKLASIFYRLGFVEAFGTGIPRIMGDYRDAGVKPSIDLSTNVFKLELPRRTSKGADQSIIDDVMEYARSRESFTRSEIEDLVDVSKSKITSILLDMQSEGLIEKYGEGRATKYKVINR